MAYNKPRAGKKEKRWSIKYKKSINCNNPKGFSQINYCKRKKRGGKYKNESFLSLLMQSIQEQYMIKFIDLLENNDYKKPEDNKKRVEDEKSKNDEEFHGLYAPVFTLIGVLLYNLNELIKHLPPKASEKFNDDYSQISHITAAHTPEGILSNIEKFIEPYFISNKDRNKWLNVIKSSDEEYDDSNNTRNKINNILDGRSDMSTFPSREEIRKYIKTLKKDKFSREENKYRSEYDYKKSIEIWQDHADGKIDLTK